jgi:type II secretory pathway pseudopilin PulG
VLILALVIAGVILGGVAAWMRQSKWRGRARQAETQARALQHENAQLKRRDGQGLPGQGLPSQGSPGIRAAVDHAPRLSIPPPAG